MEKRLLSRINGRRKGREESDLDWDDIFGTLNKIRNEIKENFPYKYLEVFGAEADDIIGFFAKKTEMKNNDNLWR